MPTFAVLANWSRGSYRFFVAEDRASLQMNIVRLLTNTKAVFINEYPELYRHGPLCQMTAAAFE
jgi:hypothetical protein